VADLHILGGFSINISLAIGAFIGLIWVVWKAQINEVSQRLEAGLWSLSGAIIFGRSLYIAVNWSTYRTASWQILRIDLGGVYFVGSLAGGILSLVIFTILHKLMFAKITNDLTPLLITLSVSIWLGCWLEGCGYGQETYQWWGVPALNEWGMITYRIPLQPISALLTIILFWSLERFSKELYLEAEIRLCLGFLGISMIIFIHSLIRVDPTPLWLNLRMGTWISLVYVLAALSGLCIPYLRKRLEKMKKK
jgi:phosphatidylglycerol---prolipoprotein diacylglyceryl transferase